jgi:hypothetical protein
MIRNPRLGLDTRRGSLAPPWTDETTGAEQEGQRLLGRREPGGEKMQVDVEERDRGGAADAVEHGLGPDQNRYRTVREPWCRSPDGGGNGGWLWLPAFVAGSRDLLDLDPE